MTAAPILQPVAEAQAMRPVHFGIMMIAGLDVVALWSPLSLFLLG